MTKYARGLGMVLWLLAAVPAAAADRPNLILIGVDAMRTDHLASYGYGRVTTPTIDAVAAKGTRFLDATTLIPLTNPSMSTFFTSHSPGVTGVKRNGTNLRPDLATLTEILKRAGYTTAAVQGCWALYHYRSGLERGFDYYLDQGVHYKFELDSEIMTSRSIKLMDQLQPPFFFWTHYSDPHQPHKAMAGFEFDSNQDHVGLGTKTADNYDSELKYVDDHVRRLLAEFERRGLLNNTLVVIIADHGEELGERNGYIGHGRGMYQTVLHVPVIMAGPRIPAGARLPGLASMLDLAPTLLAYLGLPALPDPEGRNLLPALLAADQPGAEKLVAPAPPVFFETYGLAILDVPGRKFIGRVTKPLIMGMRDGERKVFFSKHGQKWELYDLAADPEEQTNLIDPSQPLTQDLTRRLSDWYQKQYKKPLPVPKR
jgi:arylsulfatase A-like enzyme